MPFHGSLSYVQVTRLPFAKCFGDLDGVTIGGVAASLALAIGARRSDGYGLE